MPWSLRLWYFLDEAHVPARNKLPHAPLQLKFQIALVLNAHQTNNAFLSCSSTDSYVETLPGNISRETGLLSRPVPRLFAQTNRFLYRFRLRANYPISRQSDRA